VAISPDELMLLTRLANDAQALSVGDERMSRYYEGAQRLEHIGIAVPPELRRFETVVNWPRVNVDTIEHRQDVKSLLLPGQDKADVGLREGWDANNLDSDLSLLNKDLLIFGRGFMCAGTNAEDKDHPLLTVESPREMTGLLNSRTRRLDAVLRLYGQTKEDTRPQFATLYMPDQTLWIERNTSGKWVEFSRDVHRLGRVPVVMFLNRRRTGGLYGRSEMADIIPLTDAAARSLTNLQIAGETHSVPQKWVLGMSKGDFVDADGAPVPAWQSYFSAIWANQNKDAKVGQFTASDLKNFHDTVNHYGQLAASITGFPARYFGQNTTNPPAEGAIRAEEAQMVKTIERKNVEVGSGLGWVMGLYERLRTGDWVSGNRIHIEWHDPGTPTFAQRADALQKMAGGVPLISRQGAWDELGWSDPRKDRERRYFEEESSDPYVGLILAKEEAAASTAEVVTDAPATPAPVS